VTRAVLDANVFVTAVLTPAGVAAAVLEAWRAERFELLASSATLDEVARVLAYPKIARRHGWSRREILAFVRELEDLAVVTPGQVELSVIREDPDDNRYLECAVEGRAEYIVSGDRHLLALGTYRQIAIVTPRAFLSALPRASS
jgi:putative PIN family toxin of toxin-antitoxin system